MNAHDHAHTHTHTHAHAHIIDICNPHVKVYKYFIVDESKHTYIDLGGHTGKIVFNDKYILDDDTLYLYYNVSGILDNAYPELSLNMVPDNVNFIHNSQVNKCK